MKTSINKLKQIIREVISEAGTSGTSGTRGGVAVPGSSNVYGNSDDVWFPGHDDNYPVNRTNSNDNEMSSQGLSSPGSAYSPQASNASSDDMGDMIDDNMQEPGRLETEFVLVIDSQVTRGKSGEIRDTASSNSFSVQEDKASGTLGGDLYWLWQNGYNKSSAERSEGIISLLMKYQVVNEEAIDQELIEEFGIKGRDSNKVYSISEYFDLYNNGVIKEARKRARILKKRSARRI